MNQPALHLVDAETGEILDAPSYGELVDRLTAQEDINAGQEATLKSQSATIGRLKRQIEADNDPEHHPQRKEIADLIDHWKAATDHPRAKQSKDRFDVIKARLKDGYSLEQLRLAIDGIAAYPYVKNGQRVATGTPSQRHDKLSLALGSGENVERFANLGARAAS